MARLSYGKTLKLAEVVKSFIPDGKIENIKSFGDGRINSTYLITVKENNIFVKYLLQNVNHKVFTDTETLMSNIVAVTRHITNQGGKSLQFLRCVNVEKCNGPYIYVDHENQHWRMYHYIDAEVYSCVIEAEDAYRLGQSIADFSHFFENFDTSLLVETIPDFHNTIKRFETFLLAIAEDLILENHRTEKVKDEIAFLLKHQEVMGLLVEAQKNGEIPIGVVHNDPKISNALFSKVTGAPICMIDLDTVMPGTPLYDIGDALRSIANTDSEEAKTTENVSFSVEVYEAFMNGYISEMNRELTKQEKDLIPYSPLIIALELGMRFLTDHIQGNIYFKTEYDGQNLERARVQFALAKDIEQKINSGVLQKVLKTSEV